MRGLAGINVVEECRQSRNKSAKNKGTIIHCRDQVLLPFFKTRIKSIVGSKLKRAIVFCVLELRVESLYGSYSER